MATDGAAFITGHSKTTRILLRAGFASLSLASATQAFALDPARSLHQLHHTAWTVEDGAPPDIWALAQSPDGYLWLGTGAGLYRFDGVRFEKFRPAGAEQMPSRNINALFADPSGDIWIGYVSGAISRLRDGHLTTFDLGIPDAPVYQIVVDQDHVVWAALHGYAHGGLAKYAHGSWQVLGPEAGFPEGGPSCLLLASDGTLWATANKKIYILRHGAAHFEPLRDPPAAGDRFAQAPNGRIWLSDFVQAGIHGLSARPQEGSPDAGRETWLQPPPAPEPATNHILIDRDGAIWGTYQVGGLFRITRAPDPPAGSSAKAGITERFSMNDGLSSDLARPMLEDREGNIWVGTNLGLDRFRNTNVVAAQGIPPTSSAGYFMTRGEGASVYIVSGDTLYRAHPDQPAEILGHFTSHPTFLSGTRDSGIWAGFVDGLSRLQSTGLQPVDLPAEATGRIASWMQDASGQICISVVRKGMFCRTGNTWQQRALHLSDMQPTPAQLAADTQGRAWLNYNDKLALLNGPTLRVFSAADGLDIGNIDTVAPGPEYFLAGGEFGVARFDGRRFTSLRSEQNPVFSRITGIVETAQGDVWLNGIMGVIRMSSRNLSAAFEHPGQSPPYVLFNLADGLPGVAQQDSDTQTVLQAADGRLWFVTNHGVAWLDPSHLVRNPLPPPVSIRSVTANNREYLYPGTLALPKGTSNLQIDYTALSLSVPERVRFRYRLDGVDRDWIDPGSRRQAFYTKLDPGNYKFHVIAANNDGVWNTTGATLNVVIPPTFLQSDWFKMLLVIGAGTQLWLLYSIRVRQIANRLHGRLEERLGERERIARELHDTLLQGFQGLVLRFQAINDQIQPTHPARPPMEKALDLADTILAEGRDRVLDLRADEPCTDLSEILTASARKIVGGFKIGFTLIVEGRPRPVHQIVQEEIARIADEALCNAVRHGRPDHIEIAIVYYTRECRVYFRDDGAGIDPGVLAAGGRNRHFGMTGMRERAQKIRGQFTVSSRLGHGTEIALSVPAAIAYAKPKGRRWYPFSPQTPV